MPPCCITHPIILDTSYLSANPGNCLNWFSSCAHIFTVAVLSIGREPSTTAYSKLPAIVSGDTSMNACALFGRSPAILNFFCASYICCPVSRRFKERVWNPVAEKYSTIVFILDVLAVVAILDAVALCRPDGRFPRSPSLIPRACCISSITPDISLRLFAVAPVSGPRE